MDAVDAVAHHARERPRVRGVALVEVLGFVTTVRANVAWGEDLVIAVRADLTDQPVALFLESPVPWNFHCLIILSEIIAFY